MESHGSPKKERAVHVVMVGSTKRDATCHTSSMSETPADSPVPRRSQRDKRAVKPFVTGLFILQKLTILD